MYLNRSLKPFFLILFLAWVSVFTGGCLDLTDNYNDPANTTPYPIDDDDSDNPVDDDDDDDDSDNPQTPYSDIDTDLNLTKMSNGLIYIKIDGGTGNILAIDDLTKTPILSFLNKDLQGYQYFTPFRVYDFRDFQTEAKEKAISDYCLPVYPPVITKCDEPPDKCRRIVWQCTADGSAESDTLAIFEGKIELPPDRAAVRFTGGVKIVDDTRVLSITYPVLGSFEKLTPEDDLNTMAVPYEGGMLIKDPLERVRDEQTENAVILKEMVYPSGHSMMLQMISYQAAGVGGLLIYTPDPNYTMKYFRVQDATPAFPKTSMIIGIEHFNWDINDVFEAGGMYMDYPVELMALSEKGTWQEAATIYREWGENQIWAQSPIAQREEKDRAIFEHTAFSVFGLSARTDQTEWFRAFHQQICDGIDNAKILFVLGWDFHPNGEIDGTNLHAFLQAGHNESYWIPFQGAFVNNYRVIKEELDDFIYPFFYDLLIHDTFPMWDGWTGNPGDTGDPGAPWCEHEIINMYGFPGGFFKRFLGWQGFARTLNPVNQTVQDFYKWRNELIVDTWQDGTHIQLDGTYHDISASIVALGSFDPSHDSPMIGHGRWITESMRKIHDDLIGQGPARNFSMGAENSVEPYWDQYDYYHLGDTGIGPIRNRDPSSTNSNPNFNGYHRWFMEGDAVDIPLTAYVYHPYGSMRLGGKIQISYQMGDLFYWAVASEYLWGGIIELIYFNTPVEILPDMDPSNVTCPGGWPCAFQTGWASGPYGNQRWFYDEEVYEADPDKLEYLRQAAYLRVVAATDYLASGQMMPPPSFLMDPGTVSYDYDYYSHILGSNYEHYGDYEAQALLVEAWQKWGSDETAFILANPTNIPRIASLVFDPADYGLETATPTLKDVYPPLSADQPLADCTGGSKCYVVVTVPARSFSMIELKYF